MSIQSLPSPVVFSSSRPSVTDTSVAVDSVCPEVENTVGKGIFRVALVTNTIVQ